MANLIDATQEDLLRRCAEDNLNELEQKQVNVILEMFVNGTLDDVESERVLSILGDNDSCMELLERIWQNHPLWQAMANTPLPDGETSKRMAEGVVRRIRRSNATGTLAKFGISGFGAVASGLLKPLIKQNRWETGRRSRRNRRKSND